jgi:hypothetical protein
VFTKLGITSRTKLVRNKVLQTVAKADVSAAALLETEGRGKLPGD